MERHEAIDARLEMKIVDGEKISIVAPSAMDGPAVPGFDAP
jgi:hypothetical protein